MSGYNLVQKIRRLEQELDQLGFAMTSASHYYRDYGDVVAIKPKDADSLPIYSRDAELFIGTIDALEYWIQGVQWARNYDRLLRLSTDGRREKKEQDYRSEQLFRMLAAPATAEPNKKV